MIISGKVSSGKYNSLNYLLLLISFLFIIDASATCQTVAEMKLNKVPKLIFITPAANRVSFPEELKDAKSLENSVEVASFSMLEMTPEQISLKKLTEFDAIILPYATAKSLNGKDAGMIVDAVKSGVNIILDGNSKVTEMLSVKHMKDSLTVKRIRDLNYSKNKLYWTVPCKLVPIDNSAKSLTVLCVDD